MCGIVGYIGKRQASEVILNGLQRLEYRGYDSAGFAILDDDMKILKVKGKVAQTILTGLNMAAADNA